MHRRELIGTLAGSALASTATVEAASAVAPSGWEQVLADRLPLYGHRNWIVVADSAYPAQSRPGIETVVSGAKHSDVLQTTLGHLARSEHVRPIILQDQELQFVPEEDAPGVDGYRRQLASVLKGRKVDILPHLEIIRRLDETAQTFRVLIIKTTETIPYTSVFLQLDCAYWPASAEERMRARMAAQQR